jgi:hypothetical protein
LGHNGGPASDGAATASLLLGEGFETTASGWWRAGFEARPLLGSIANAQLDDVLVTRPIFVLADDDARNAPANRARSRAISRWLCARSSGRPGRRRSSHPCAPAKSSRREVLSESRMQGNPHAFHPIPSPTSCVTGSSGIERFFNKLKHFQHIATRCDRRAVHFLAALYLTSAMIWMR